MKLFRERLADANRLYLDLIETLGSAELNSRLPGVRSSAISNHFWCVVGARESYTRAAQAGSWQGFASSLTEPVNPDAVRAALTSSAALVDAWLSEVTTTDEYGANMAFNLLEHEAQHHGQLIRYLYGLPLPIPESWAKKYALDPS